MAISLGVYPIFRHTHIAYGCERPFHWGWLEREGEQSKHLPDTKALQCWQCWRLKGRCLLVRTSLAWDRIDSPFHSCHIVRSSYWLTTAPESTCWTSLICQESKEDHRSEVDAQICEDLPNCLASQTQTSLCESLAATITMSFPHHSNFSIIMHHHSNHACVEICLPSVNIGMGQNPSKPAGKPANPFLFTSNTLWWTNIAIENGHWNSGFSH